MKYIEKCINIMTPLYILCLLQLVRDRCLSNSRVDLAHFLFVHANCSYHGNKQDFIFHLDFDVVLPDNRLSIAPIHAVPVVPTALSKNLCGSLSVSELQGEAKSGWVCLAIINLLKLSNGVDDESGIYLQAKWMYPFDLRIKFCTGTITKLQSSALA